jgi:hypothetical protein
VLTELTPLESSLEDVFRELTEARDAPAGTAPDSEVQDEMSEV